MPLGVLAIDKPEGIRSHPNQKKIDSLSLLRAYYQPRDECYYWKDPTGRSQRLYLLHRLDSPTSGIILMAKDVTIAKSIKSCFAEGKVKKTYHAIVSGFPKPTFGIWKDSIKKNTKDSFVRSNLTSDSSNIAISKYQVIGRIRRNRILTKLVLEPKTGKTHQLRLQCASHGFPILGDRTYGNFTINRWAKQMFKTKRLFLHSQKIEFQLKYKQKFYCFSAESQLPEDFTSLNS